MNLLWPAALLALLAVPVAVLIAMWRARRRDLTVPSLLFWERLIERMADAGRQRRKVVDISLVLAALAALLFAVAAAGPVLKSDSAPEPTLLVIADVSASMQMQHGGETRARALQRKVPHILEWFHASEIYLATSPQIGGALFTPIDDLSQALPQPTDRPGDLAADIARILAAAKTLEPYTVVVITDSPEKVPEGIHTVSVGGAANNLFFSRFGQGKNSILLAVGNAGPQRNPSIRLLADNLPIADTMPEAVDQDDEYFWVLEDDRIAGAKFLEARIFVEDDLAADNVFYAVRQPERSIRALMIGAANPYVERALLAHPDVELEYGAEPSDADSYDLLIYHGVTPTKIFDTPTVVINPPRSFEGCIVGAATSNLAIVSVGDDPLVAHSGLADVRIGRARTIQAEGSTLAATDAGAVAVRTRNIICLGFALNPDVTDWVLRPGFPVFWISLLEEIAGSRSPAFGWQPLGAAVPVLITTNDATLRMVHPRRQGVARPQPGTFLLDPDFAGVYELTDGDTQRLFAFNLMNTEESSTSGAISQPEPDAVGAGVVAGAMATDTTSLMAAVLCLGLLSAGACWYFKR